MLSKEQKEIRAQYMREWSKRTGYYKTEKCRKQSCVRQARYMKRHHARILEERKIWRCLNKNKERQHNRRSRPSKKAYYQRNRIKWYGYWLKRKALMFGNSAVNCTEKIALIARERFCRWCCIALTDGNRTIDHVVPLSRGGSHIPDNLVAACERCNKSRNNKLVEEWTWELAA